MRIPGLAAEYERTCADCGYAWRVPRAFRRRKVKSISAFSVGDPGRYPARGGIDRAELNAEVQSIMALGEQADAFRRCPKCGSEHHTQRPVRP